MLRYASPGWGGVQRRPAVATRTVLGAAAAAEAADGRTVHQLGDLVVAAVHTQGGQGAHLAYGRAPFDGHAWRCVWVRVFCLFV